MDESDRKVLLKQFEKDLSKESKDEIKRAERISLILHENTQQFLVLLKALKKLDDKEGTNYLETTPGIIMSTFSMELSDNIDSSIALFKKWFTNGFEVIKECDDTLIKN